MYGTLTTNSLYECKAHAVYGSCYRLIEYEPHVFAKVRGQFDIMKIIE